MASHIEVRACPGAKQTPALLKTLRQQATTVCLGDKPLFPEQVSLAAVLRRHGLAVVRAGKAARLPVVALIRAPLHDGADLLAAAKAALAELDGSEHVCSVASAGPCRPAEHYVGVGGTRGGTRDELLQQTQPACVYPWKSFAELQTVVSDACSSRLQVFAFRSELASPWLGTVRAERPNGTSTQVPHNSLNLRVDFRPGDPCLVGAGSRAAWGHCVVDHKHARLLPILETRVSGQGRRNVKRGAPGSPAEPLGPTPTLTKATYGEVPFECLPSGHVLHHPCMSVVLHARQFSRADIFAGGGQALVEFARTRGWAGQNLQFPDHNKVRSVVYWVYRGRCNACNRTLPLRAQDSAGGSEIDHIVPQRDARGSSDGLPELAPVVHHLWNLQLLCGDCHSVKTQVVDCDHGGAAAEDAAGLRELRHARRLAHGWASGGKEPEVLVGPHPGGDWADRMQFCVTAAMTQLGDAGGPVPEQDTSGPARQSGPQVSISEGCRSLWGLREESGALLLHPMTCESGNAEKSWRTGPFWYLWQTVGHGLSHPQTATADLQRRHTTALWQAQALTCGKDAAGVRISRRTTGGVGGGGLVDDSLAFLSNLSGEVSQPGPKQPWLLPGVNPTRRVEGLKQIIRPQPQDPEARANSTCVDLEVAPCRHTLTWMAAKGWVRRSFWLVHLPAERVPSASVQARRAEGLLTVQPQKNPAESPADYSEWAGATAHVDLWVRRHADLE